MRNLTFLKPFLLISAYFVPSGFCDEDIVRASNLLTLRELETAMLDQSLETKSKEYEVAAAKEKRESLPSNYIPRLVLEGSFKYSSDVPEINGAPGRTLQFSDNKVYSIGPTLTMTLVDFNSKAHLQDSLDKALSAKQNEEMSLKSNVLFKVRYHYINLAFLRTCPRSC